MYSKREICFTITLALGIFPGFNPRQDTSRLRSPGPCLTLVDGVHPPPPVLPPPKLGSTGQLQADGVHPPPPVLPAPKLGSTGQLQAASTKALLSPWRSYPRLAS